MKHVKILDKRKDSVSVTGLIGKTQQETGVLEKVLENSPKIYLKFRFEIPQI